MSEDRLELIKLLNFASKSGYSGWWEIAFKEAWKPWYRWYSQIWTVIQD